MGGGCRVEGEGKGGEGVEGTNKCPLLDCMTL